MTLEQKKYRLIQEIISVNQTELIDAIDELIEKFTTKSNDATIDLSSHDNITEKVDLESIKRERPISNLDIKEFSKEADELEWDKSIEELLIDLN